MTTKERVAWVNGKTVAESQATISINDVGFLYGDAVFDTTRTFDKRIFKLKGHLNRFYESLNYMRIDPGMSKEKMAETTMDILNANLPLLGPNEDYWVSQRVSRGLRTDSTSTPTIVIECFPLPLKERAKSFRDGLQIVIPSIRRTPPESMSPRAKVHNYINMIQGDLEVRSQNPEALAILLDTNGNIAEGMGSNFFIVKDGVLSTPRDQFILGGISRETTIELAHELNMEVRKEDIDLFDAYNADEAFVTSTSYCICPVSTFNGMKIGSGKAGPITDRLQKAYSGLVDMDFVAQYLAHL